MNAQDLRKASSSVGLIVIVREIRYRTLTNKLMVHWFQVNKEGAQADVYEASIYQFTPDNHLKLNFTFLNLERRNYPTMEG